MVTGTGGQPAHTHTHIAWLAKGVLASLLQELVMALMRTEAERCHCHCHLYGLGLLLPWPHSRCLHGTCVETSSKAVRTMSFHSCADIPIEAIVEDSVDSSLDVPLPAPWDDVPATASGEDNMQAVAAEPQQPTEAVAVSSLGETSAEMEEEANKKGYGRAYAAFGGGRDGLEACAASKSLLS